MLHVKLIKYHDHGNMILILKVPRNIVLDYMTQANFAAKDYLSNGWHLVHAHIE